MVTFREYQPNDREACLALLDANTPEFFAASERSDFEAFLDDIPGTYLVLVEGGQVIGCGGYIPLPESRVAHTSWGMVHPDVKGRGLGRKLFEARLAAVRERGDADRMRVITSQMTAPFFQHMGFEEVGRTADKIAPGIDEVELWLEL